MNGLSWCQAKRIKSEGGVEKLAQDKKTRRDAPCKACKLPQKIQKDQVKVLERYRTKTVG